MGFTTILATISMVAIASAGFPGWPANDSPFPGFSSPMFNFNNQKIKPNQFKNFDHFKKFEDFNNFGFRNTFTAIDPKTIETYVPGEGESFKGQSIRTHTFSSNNNGQIKEGGSSTIIDNNNGHVKKEKVAFNSDGTQP